MSIRYQNNQKRKSYRPKLTITEDAVIKDDVSIPFSDILEIHKDNQANKYIQAVAIIAFFGTAFSWLMGIDERKSATIFMYLGIPLMSFSFWQGRWTALYTVSKEREAFKGRAVDVLLVSKNYDEILELGEKIRAAAKKNGQELSFETDVT